MGPIVSAGAELRLAVNAPANGVSQAIEGLFGKGQKTDPNYQAVEVAVNGFTNVTAQVFASMDIPPAVAKLGAKVVCVWLAAAAGVAGVVLCPPAAPFIVGMCGSVCTAAMAA